MTGEEVCRELEAELAAGATLDELQSLAIEKLHYSNARFHWTGIYELFPENVLKLGPFIGAPTDHVFISVGTGVCGSAVAERRNKNIPDVTKEENYLACSTSTKSELVILIRKGDTIFAQIDIDSHELDAFDAKAVKDVEIVADWLAGVYIRDQESNGMGPVGTGEPAMPRASHG